MELVCLPLLPGMTELPSLTVVSWHVCDTRAHISSRDRPASKQRIPGLNERLVPHVQVSNSADMSLRRHDCCGLLNRRVDWGGHELFY